MLHFQQKKNIEEFSEQNIFQFYKGKMHLWEYTFVIQLHTL